MGGWIGAAEARRAGHASREALLRQLGPPERGQFYTPTHVVRVLVEMLAPYKGRV